MPKKKKAALKIDLSKEQIVQKDVMEADKEDFLNYGITVASERAIPDVKDGLKPIQRFILIAMHDAHLSSKAKTIKSQKVEGNVMGDYSPHTGSYLSIDYLTQKFTFNLPPIEGKGNFSAINDNKPAAARYTEIHNSIYGDDFVDRISPDLVPYASNYSNNKMYPTVLPVSFPALLINGVKTGIAVGFTSSILPHNPVDAMKLTIAYLKNSQIELKEAMSILNGPDLPTGGTLSGDFETYYRTGEGTLVNQGTIIDSPDDKNELIITEVPYQLGGRAKDYVNQVNEMIGKNQLPGIKRLEDYTSTDGLQISVILQKDFDHQQAKSMLFTKTNLQKNYYLSWFALDGKTPIQFNLISYLEYYVSFQHRLMINEFKSVVKKTTNRLKEIAVLLTIPSQLTELIKVARLSNGRSELEQILTGQKTLNEQSFTFNYDEPAAKMISGMRIYEFNKVNETELEEEQKELKIKNMWAKRYISETPLRTDLLIKRHESTLKKYEELKLGTHKTRIISAEKVNDMKFVPKDVEIPLTISINKYGYVKTTDQLKTNSDELPENVVQRYDTNTTDALIVITNQGNMYQISTSQLKRLPTRDKTQGETIYAIMRDQGLSPDEKILNYSFRSTFESPEHQLIFISQLGLAKRLFTKDSTLITKTLRKHVQAYKPKTNDELLMVKSITTPIDNLEIAFFRDQKVKRIQLADISEQKSQTAVGNMIFKSKDETINKDVFIFDNTNKEYKINYLGQIIDVIQQPLIKATQVFKDIIH